MDILDQNIFKFYRFLFADIFFLKDFVLYVYFYTKT